jgi:hypothetical protein
MADADAHAPVFLADMLVERADAVVAAEPPPVLTRSLPAASSISS